jgi:6-phosphogluconolactonase (cycloisomerase 2 family)
MTNRAEGNSVLVYTRDSNGGLSKIQEAPTQGLGTGFTADPLQSQGALTLSGDGRFLFAVNPASGDLTTFLVKPGGLEFASKVPSGGAFPVSVTEHNGLVFVLNQLGIANISGYSVDAAGQLKPIPNGRRTLAGAALSQPAQVTFTPDGTKLIVTEKGTDLIDIFQVAPIDPTKGLVVQRSSGHTPFGFAFGPSGSVIVSEVERRLPMQSTVSSYLQKGAGLTPVSPAVPNGQSGSCWVAVTGNTAWIVNTGSGTISAYHVASDGTLTLANPTAANLGAMAGPIDLVATPDGKFIYVLESTAGALAAFQVNGDSLTPLFTLPDLPLSIQGIARR